MKTFTPSKILSYILLGIVLYGLGFAVNSYAARCDMYNIPGWSISGDSYVRTFSENTSGSITLRDRDGNTHSQAYGISYIDKSTPGAANITADDRSNDQWSRDNTTVITANINRTGEVSPRFNRYCMDSSNRCTPNSTTAPDTSNLSDGTYYYRVRTCTQTDRCGPISIFILKIDTRAPLASDISIVPSESGALLASDSQNFRVTVGDAGGSAVTRIEGFFEDYNTRNNYLPNPEVSGSNTLSFDASIQSVDNDRQTAGYRPYQLYIYEVCDEAGNCTRETDSDGIRTFTYRVYPNTNVLGTTSVTTNELDDSSNIADGSSKSLAITLEDTYGNAVIPASGIGRNIDIDINTDNNLLLNQFSRSGGSSIFTDNAPWQIGNNITRSFQSQSSSDGVYTYELQAYTPTNQSQYADPEAIFNINEISVDISGTIGAVSDINIGNANIVGNFNPLYITTFDGELTNNGFIEGAPQASNITTIKASSPVTPSSRELSVYYGGETNNLRLDISRAGPPTTAVSEIDLSTVLENNFGSNRYDFNTLLTQGSGTIEDISETYLSSHVSYTLDGRDVVYNGDVVGKTNFHDANINNNTNQSGLKVIGISSSENANELTRDQFTDDVTILGKLTKSTSRQDIQSKVFSVIKRIDSVNGSNRITRLDGASWGNNSDGTKLVNDSVLYFGNVGGNTVELGNGTDEVIEGRKTLVVEGGDLYIRSNMTYGDTSTDILGIVILQDEAGNGGNLYIHPDVTNIVGTIYVDKSVISYNGTSELDGNTQASVLSNQLYIFGSLFSENTIGGSRSNPLECPYYVSVCNSTIEAQKYDLNYLRRYFVADTDNDGNKDTPSGETVFSPGDNYYEYPVVVEYNSSIQLTPPPLFD